MGRKSERGEYYRGKSMKKIVVRMSLHPKNTGRGEEEYRKR